MRFLHSVVALPVAVVVLGGPSALSARADRAVVWTTASEGALERELNMQAARGLRVAAVADGLPCSLTVLQAPARPAPASAYRVIGDRDLPSSLSGLVDAGFIPRFSVRRLAARPHVIFERGEASRTVAAWRVIEFAEMGSLESAVADAARDGYQARVFVRPALRSWPGLSEKGIILAVRASTTARESRVVIGTSKKIDEVAKAVSAATTAGWSVDLLFTTTRDGSRDARRERLAVLLSRDPAARPSPASVRMERSSTFGVFGRGPLLGAVPFWDEYTYAWSPVDRRQTWASPIRLTANEAQCLGLEFKLRADAPHDHTWSITGLLARPLEIGGYELVYLTDQGGS